MRAAVAIALSIAASACSGPSAMDGEPVPEAATGAASEARAEGPIVATVDGVDISLREVEDVVRRTGLSPRQALTRLEEEVVLARAAEAEGMGDDDPEVRDVERRAAVQALLAREIEERIRPETIPDEEVAERLLRDLPMFAQPERRASVHVLARPIRDAPPEADAAAERFARRVLSELMAEADPAAAAERYRDENVEGRTFEILVEAVPAARREGDLAAPYAAGLFGPTALGLVPEVVHSRFGWHVIVVTEILPPWEMPREEAESLVRRQLAVEARAAALVALEDRLMAEHPPVLDERGVSLALRPVEGPVDREDGSSPEEASP